MLKVILNPKYEIVHVRANGEDKKIYMIKRRKNGESEAHSKQTQ